MGILGLLAATFYKLIYQKLIKTLVFIRNLGYLEDAYLFSGAKRYDIKGKEFFKSIAKYYCCDIGFRNIRLNFRQQEGSHLIYNELSSRGYLVNVGMIESREMKKGKSQYIQYEVDFIATNGIDKYYIQSAFAIESEEKQELRSLKKINNSFQKIVIVRNDIATYTDYDGIIFMGLFQFLMNDDILIIIVPLSSFVIAVQE